MDDNKAKELAMYCAVVDLILKEYRSGGYDELIEKNRKEL